MTDPTRRPWVPMPVDWWPVVAESIPHPWPREAVLLDLRWHHDQNRMQRVKMLSTRTAAERWGWSHWKARQTLKAEREWMDSAHLPHSRRTLAAHSGEDETTESCESRTLSAHSPHRNLNTRVEDTLHTTHDTLSPSETKTGAHAPTLFPSSLGSGQPTDGGPDADQVGGSKSADSGGGLRGAGSLVADSGQGSHGSAVASGGAPLTVGELPPAAPGPDAFSVVLDAFVSAATERASRESSEAPAAVRRPRITPKSGDGRHVAARIREHGVDAVCLVLRWWQLSEHQRAAFLRDGGYSWKTVCGPKFVQYLELAEDRSRGWSAPSTARGQRPPAPSPHNAGIIRHAPSAPASDEQAAASVRALIRDELERPSSVLVSMLTLGMGEDYRALWPIDELARASAGVAAIASGERDAGINGWELGEVRRLAGMYAAELAARRRSGLTLVSGG